MVAIILIFNNSKNFGLHEYIKIRRRHTNIFTPHVTRSRAVPIFCELELPLRAYDTIKTLSFSIFKANFIMLQLGNLY